MNNELAEQRGLSVWDKVSIVDLHAKKRCLLGAMKRTKSIDKLKDMYMRVTNIEFALQQLWKFELNQNYHKFWNVPHCTCPKIDNAERYPSGDYIYNSNCIFHGVKK